MARKVIPYVMLLVAGGILLLIFMNTMKPRNAALEEVAEYTPPSVTPEPAPAAGPEPTPEWTPEPEAGPTLEEVLNRLQGKFHHYGRVSGRLENETYSSKMYVQKDPCVARVFTQWETVDEESLQVGKATFDLPFGLLRDPVAETLRTGDRGVCRIKLRLKGNRRFKLDDKRQRIVILHLASETLCREMVEELILAKEHCQNRAAHE